MASLMWLKGTPVSGLSRSDRRSAVPQGLHDLTAAKSAQVSREEVLTDTTVGRRPCTCEAQLYVYEYVCVCVCVWCVCGVCVFPPGQSLHMLVKLPLKLPVPAFKEIPGLVLLITLKIYFIFRKQTQWSLKELPSH